MIRPSFPLLAQLEARPEFVGFSPDAHRLWRQMAENVDATTTAAGLHLMFGVAATTLTSRLNRDGLPSARDLLCAMRALRAGQLYDPAGPVATVAYALHFASPQAMNRHFRRLRGRTGKQYLMDFVWPVSFNRFVSTYYTPCREVWRTWRAVRRPSQLMAVA